MGPQFTLLASKWKNKAEGVMMHITNFDVFM